MPGTPVYVRGLRGVSHARLLVWGRCEAEAQWWGLVTWDQKLDASSGPPRAMFAAWVPADVLSLPAWGRNPMPIPRTMLAAESAQWPAPPGWSPQWFVGRWNPSESQLVPPASESPTSAPC